MKCEGVLWERLWQPFFLAALNTQPEEGAASLAARLMRETFAKGGLACRPLVAAQGLSTAFITPALQHLERQGVDIRFERRLSAIATDGDNVKALSFGDETIALERGDALVLAVPAPVAASLLPALPTPQSFRAIVNAHYKIDPPPGQPPILGDHQRHDGMAVRLPRPAVGHDQRRRPPDCDAAGGACRENLV